VSRRIAVWGAIAIAAYAAAAAFTAGRLPVRPLFDGLAPPAAYNWVSPPPGQQNQASPTGASEKLPLKPAGTDEISVATSDGQATLILPAGAFARHGKDADVRVDIAPLDPARYGSPPQRLAYQGNAYSIKATYEPGNTTAELALGATMLLTYPTNATKILRRSGSAWSQLATTDVAASLQVFARTKQLGVFVPAGPATSNALRWWTLGIASGIAALLGLTFGLRERRRLHRQ
jgi:hypothetical protein